MRGEDDGDEKIPTSSPSPGWSRVGGCGGSSMVCTILVPRGECRSSLCITVCVVESLRDNSGTEGPVKDPPFFILGGVSSAWKGPGSKFGSWDLCMLMLLVLVSEFSSRGWTTRREFVSEALSLSMIVWVWVWVWLKSTSSPSSPVKKFSSPGESDTLSPSGEESSSGVSHPSLLSGLGEVGWLVSVRAMKTRE